MNLKENKKTDNIYNIADEILVISAKLVLNIKSFLKGTIFFIYQFLHIH